MCPDPNPLSQTPDPLVRDPHSRVTSSVVSHPAWCGACMLRGVSVSSFSSSSEVNRCFTRAALSVAMGATADQTWRFRLYLFSASISEIMSFRLNSVWLLLHHQPQFLRGKLLLNRNSIYGNRPNCSLNCTFLPQKCVNEEVK